MSISILACDEQFESLQHHNDLLYFPLEPGNEWIYDQIHITYEISGFDTIHLEVKEVVTDKKNEGDYVNYVIERSTRSNTNQNWEIDSIYQIRQSNDLILTQINNITTTTLSFPVYIDKQWNINSHNTLTQKMVTYTDVPTDIMTDYSALVEVDTPDIMVVIEDYPQDFIKQDEQYEVYVSGIGLIEKYSVVLEFCQQNCDSAGQIDNGYLFSKRLKSYVVQ